MLLQPQTRAPNPSTKTDPDRCTSFLAQEHTEQTRDKFDLFGVSQKAHSRIFPYTILDMKGGPTPAVASVAFSQESTTIEVGGGGSGGVAVGCEEGCCGSVVMAVVVLLAFDGAGGRPPAPEPVLEAVGRL